MCHQKTCLKIFVTVIPKERLVGGAPPILLLVWHRLQNIMSEGSRVQFYSRCHTKEGPARQSFFGRDNDKNLKAFSHETAQGDFLSLCKSRWLPIWHSSSQQLPLQRRKAQSVGLQYFSACQIFCSVKPLRSALKDILSGIPLSQSLAVWHNQFAIALLRCCYPAVVRVGRSGFH